MTQPQTTGGGFRVDVDSAAQAIVELQDAHDELVSIKEQAITLGRVTSPTRDQVSIDAAAVLSARAAS